MTGNRGRATDIAQGLVFLLLLACVVVGVLLAAGVIGGDDAADRSPEQRWRDHTIYVEVDTPRGPASCLVNTWSDEFTCWETP